MAKYLQQLRERTFVRQGGKCWWCGQPMLRPSADVPTTHVLACTAEHVTPRSRGGRDTIGNIAAAHRSCNNRGSRKPMKRHHKSG